MTDDELARELADALNVNHSPEFPARVRMRISAEPQPSARNWWFAGAAAALAVVAPVAIVWFVTMRPDPSPASSTAPAVETARQDDVAVPAPTAAPPVVSVTSPRPTVGERDRLVSAGTQRVAVARVTETAAIVVSRDEARAFGLLVARARTGAMAAALAQAGATAVEPEVPADIEIAPLEIEPLSRIAQLE